MMNKNKLNTIWLFLLLAVMLFVKCVLFHYMTFGSILVSLVMSNPFEFWKLYLPKLSISLFIASVVFLVRKKWWTVLLSFLIDAWILANLYYFRSNGIFIDVWSFTMIGNLNGFGDSILLLISCIDFIFPFLTCLYASLIMLMTWRYELNIRMVWMGIFTILLSLDVHAVGMRLLGQERYMAESQDAMQRNESEVGGNSRSYTYFNPFSPANRNSLFHVSTNDFSQEVKNYSIVHSLVCDIVDFVTMKTDFCYLSDNEQKMVELKLQDPQQDTYKRPVILILVESLEDWAVTEDVMPHLYQLAHRDSALYVPIKSQVRAGNSADGQMIINTGLLPLTSGAAAFRFPYNNYPSWIQMAEGKAATIIPHSADVWNQEVMSNAYGYDTTIVRGIEDSVLMQTAIDCLHDGYQVVQVLTMSSHSPFSYGAEHSTLNTPDWMPEYMANYLKSLACFDDALNLLINAFDTDSVFHDALLIITGDHTIFPLDKRTEYSVLASANNAKVDVARSSCPFVILGGG